MAQFVRIGGTLLVNMDNVITIDHQESSNPRVLIVCVGDLSFSIRKAEHPEDYENWKKMIESQPDIVGYHLEEGK